MKIKLPLTLAIILCLVAWGIVGACMLLAPPSSRPIVWTLLAAWSVLTNLKLIRMCPKIGRILYVIRDIFWIAYTITVFCTFFVICNPYSNDIPDFVLTAGEWVTNMSKTAMGYTSQSSALERLGLTGKDQADKEQSGKNPIVPVVGGGLIVANRRRRRKHMRWMQAITAIFLLFVLSAGCVQTQSVDEQMSVEEALLLFAPENRAYAAYELGLMSLEELNLSHEEETELFYRLSDQHSAEIDTTSCSGDPLPGVPFGMGGFIIRFTRKRKKKMRKLAKLFQAIAGILLTTALVGMLTNSIPGGFAGYEIAATSMWLMLGMVFVAMWQWYQARRDINNKTVAHQRLIRRRHAKAKRLVIMRRLRDYSMFRARVAKIIKDRIRKEEIAAKRAELFDWHPGFVETKRISANAIPTRRLIEQEPNAHSTAGSRVDHAAWNWYAYMPKNHYLEHISLLLERAIRERLNKWNSQYEIPVQNKLNVTFNGKTLVASNTPATVRIGQIIIVNESLRWEFDSRKPITYRIRITGLAGHREISKDYCETFVHGKIDRAYIPKSKAETVKNVHPDLVVDGPDWDDVTYESNSPMRLMDYGDTWKFGLRRHVPGNQKDANPWIQKRTRSEMRRLKMDALDMATAEWMPWDETPVDGTELSNRLDAMIEEHDRRKNPAKVYLQMLDEQGATLDINQPINF